VEDGSGFRSALLSYRVVEVVEYTCILRSCECLQAKELPWLPGLLFGGLSTAAGLLTLLLPETLGRPLPQTIDDIEQWYSGKQTAGETKSPADQHEMKHINRQQLDNDELHVVAW